MIVLPSPSIRVNALTQFTTRESTRERFRLQGIHVVNTKLFVNRNDSGILPAYGTPKVKDRVTLRILLAADEAV